MTLSHLINPFHLLRRLLLHCLSSAGREFQIVGAATLKDLAPYFFVLYLGTTRSPWSLRPRDIYATTNYPKGCVKTNISRSGFIT